MNTEIMKKAIEIINEQSLEWLKVTLVDKPVYKSTWDEEHPDLSYRGWYEITIWLDKDHTQQLTLQLGSSPLLFNKNKKRIQWYGTSSLKAGDVIYIPVSIDQLLCDSDGHLFLRFLCLTTNNYFEMSEECFNSLFRMNQLHHALKQWTKRESNTSNSHYCERIEKQFLTPKEEVM